MLDLFAGTGALGIEALSRGAARAVFVERDGAALARAAATNLRALGIESSEAEVRRGEALAAPCEPHAKREETYDLVFIDPPYRQAHDWGPELSPSAAAAARAARRASSSRATAGAARAAMAEVAAATALRRHFDHNPRRAITMSVDTPHEN